MGEPREQSGSGAVLVSSLLFCGLVAFSGVVFPVSVSAQEIKTSPSSTAQPQEEYLGGQEVEITKPIIWSLRQEYFNLQGDAWGNVLIFRADRVVLKGNRLTRKRGSIFRFDIPITVNNNGQNTRAGLGDIYLQDILIPYSNPKFALGAGAALTLPTATDARFGRGKWIASPIVAPVLLFQKRGFLVWKLQDYISFAGDSKRPDVHNFSVRPIFVWRFHQRWWTQIEAESVTDFEKANHTSFWTGVALGRMMNRKTGVWVKPEIGLGPYRPFDFAIRLSVFSVKP